MTIDTSNCETEPIRFPGAVQPHGALQVLRPGSGLIQAMTCRCRRGIAALRWLTDLIDIAQQAAEWFRAITGFDQVMIYRFDAAWNGEVIAEARADDVEPYLGLNFPAGDLPRQARELFRRCRVRMIPDARYTPSALLARSDDRSIWACRRCAASRRSIPKTRLSASRRG